MGKLRILHCLESVGSGGVEQLKLIKARQLDKGRYEQAMICTQAIGALPAQFIAAGCPIHEIGVFRGIFDSERYTRALAVIREFKPHIIGGIPTVVKEGETGLLVAPKAPSELADVLLGLINDLPRARSMGHAGRQRARAEFGADRYVREFDELSAARG